MLLLALALQAATSTADTPDDTRYKACLDLATSNPQAAENEAERFRISGGGGARARQCLGLAYAQEERWQEAAIAFDAAARDADKAKDALASRYWAQAGNAWLAAGDPVKAHDALSAALASNTLTGLNKGEALLDRARALVAAGQPVAARTDLDAALDEAPKDPLAWLLSATLARRTGDLPRAQGDIARAVELSPDDGSVQLEAGNIAALSKDETAAKAAWQRALKLSAPGSPVSDSARKALAQFDTPPVPGAPPVVPAPTPAK